MIIMILKLVTARMSGQIWFIKYSFLDSSNIHFCGKGFISHRLVLADG